MTTGSFRPLQTLLLVLLQGCLLVSAHDRCMAKFGNYTDDGNIDYTTLGKQFSYTGSIRGLKPGASREKLMVITLEGCENACGTSAEWHDWEQVQYTLTTWILPILGVILQLPYESNLFRASFLLTIRWLGNPVASFANVLWNMRISARCAKMADMSESYVMMEEHKERWEENKARTKRLEQAEWDQARERNRYEVNGKKASSHTNRVENTAIKKEKVRKNIFSRKLDDFWQWVYLQDLKINGQINKGKLTRKNWLGRAYPKPISELRDSLYILSVINQYEQTPKIEMVLWYALFTPGPPEHYNHTPVSTRPSTANPHPNQPLAARAVPPLPTLTLASGSAAPAANGSNGRDQNNSRVDVFESEESNFLMEPPPPRTLSPLNPNKPLPAPPVPSVKSPPKPAFNYAEARGELAEFLRRDRKHGVVLLLGSTLWFFCSFALSIYGGFVEDRGNSSRAHALGVGIFLSWLPMLSVASIVDRNSVHSDDVREELVKFLGRVRDDRIRAGDSKEGLPDGDDFFYHFAGQARRRWHYGISGRMLALLERRLSYLQWLDEREFRTSQIEAKERGARQHADHGAYFDPPLAWWETGSIRRWRERRELERIKQRDNGRHVFEYIKRGWAKFYLDGSLVREDSFKDSPEVEKLTEFYQRKRESWGPYSSHYMQSQTAFKWAKDVWKVATLPPGSVDLSLHSVNRQIAFNSEDLWQLVFSFVLVLLPVWGAFTISYHTPTVGLGCRSGGYMIYSILACSALGIEIIGWIPDKHISSQRSRIIFRVVLLLLELGNTVYLLYILFGQMVGTMNTCQCRAVMWGGQKSYNGFIVFGDDKNPQLLRDSFKVTQWWGIATGMGGIPLFFGTAYAVAEWCLQSHLWSYDEKEARRGLRGVRRWRKGTRWVYKFLRWACRFPIQIAFIFVRCAWGRKSKYPFEWKPFNRSGPGRHRSWEVPSDMEMVPVVRPGVWAKWFGGGKKTGSGGNPSILVSRA